MTAPSSPRPRFGLADAVLAWLAGLAASLAAVIPAGATPDARYVFGVVLPVQAVVTLAVLVWVSRRKGSGDPIADYGLRMRPGDLWGLVVGLALQVGLVLALAPLLERLGIRESPQELARMITAVRDPLEMAVVAAGVGLLGPLAEEVLFRGLLLRVLRSRMGDAAAVGIQAVLFGLVHLLDPGAAVAVPVFVLLGLILGAVVVRDGRLGRAFFIHAGVNLTAVGAAFLAPTLV